MRNAGYWATENAVRHPDPAWSPTMRHVAAVVAWHVGSDLTCHPTDARIAELTGRSVKTVERTMRELEAAGAIRRTTSPFSGGGRDRVITWLHSPLVPLRLVVDNSAETDTRTLTSEGSEPSPMTVRRTLTHEG